MRISSRSMGASGTLSHGNLEKKVGTSGDIIGRYERDEVTPSVEVAFKLTDVLDI